MRTKAIIGKASMARLAFAMVFLLVGLEGQAATPADEKKIEGEIDMRMNSPIAGVNFRMIETNGI